MPSPSSCDRLGDRRHLAQQADIVEAALVERRGRPLRMRRPADLALDLVDELLDALRRGVGLFLLDADQRRLVLLVGEPEIEAAVDQQRDADQPDEQQRVLAREATAGRRRRRLPYDFPNRRHGRRLCPAHPDPHDNPANYSARRPLSLRVLWPAAEQEGMASGYIDGYISRMASTYTATDASAYQRLMGRWSGGLAELLIDFAGIEKGDRVLDVGCGTGSLALALAGRTEPAAIVGIDVAAPYVAYASGRSSDPRLSFTAGDAVSMDFPPGAFDRCYSLIALNFMSDPGAALARMCRATRPGGTVAAAVWDFPGGLVYQRIFWDTAAALDPAADQARARHYSSKFTGPGELIAAFEAAGLREVCGTSLTIRIEYSAFADYWEPIANAQGPVGDYVKSLTQARLDALGEAVRRAYLAGKPDGLRSMAATAWAARGTLS